jgi:hypothetical protein
LELLKAKKPRTNEAGRPSEEILLTETRSTVSAETLREIVGAEESGVLGEDMMKYTRESRVSVNADNDQDVLLAIVWVLRN